MTASPPADQPADHIGEVNEKVDLAELKRLAEAASTVRLDAIGRLDGKNSHRLWFAFVGAVSNPATVLSLLDIIARQQEMIRADGEAFQQISDSYPLNHTSKWVTNTVRARLSARQSKKPTK